MASYHLWHPSIVRGAPATLELFITRGDAFFLARGTDALVAATLAALGIGARASRWSCAPMRSHYFGSYRDSGAWEDAWSLVWRLRVELSAAPPLPSPPTWGYFDLEAVDTSYHDDEPADDWAQWPCLLLADLPDQEALTAARALVAAHAPDAEVEVGQAFAQTAQLRAVLPDRPRAFYETGAAPAEALLVALVEAGASVHYDETLRLLHR